MTTRITGSLSSSTGINISDGPPQRDDLSTPPALIDVVELTEAEYQSLAYKVPNTIYIVV